ncbi:MAG TPA: hypothetical protein PKA17_05120, partial [Phenylobacterium sp.]|nr:hypothetical protein [Phenylobacterium sp.]
MRILLVEDDPDLTRQLKTALADAGYAVDHAPDGEEAQFLGELVGIRIDRRMELAEEVLRLEALAVMGGKVGEQTGLGRRQLELHG